MPEEITTVVFTNNTFSATSEPYHVPCGSDIVLLPGGNVYKLYDEPKTLCHEGEWTLNGELMPPPQFTKEKEKGFQSKADGYVIIQGLGGGDFVESHLHRWQAAPPGKANGKVASTLGGALSCVHVYSDGVQCADQVLAYAACASWGSRYYHREGRAA